MSSRCAVFLLGCLAAALLSSDAVTNSGRTCEPIKIEMCHDIGYNVTGMPNLAGHELQQDAQLQLQTFKPLIQYNCASQLRFFLCSVFVPMCTEKVPQIIGPCRPLCESVKRRCQPVLQEFGFPWPVSLNCSKFPPENNQLHMCMEGPKPEPDERKHFPRSRRPSITVNSHNTVSHPPNGLCANYRFGNEYFYYINRTQRCAHLCNKDILFSQDNKEFAEIWMAVWAGICFLSTLFTIVTFLMNSEKFQYPECAIIFLSISYNIYSAAYFIRLVVGREGVACHFDSQHSVPILIQEGLDNINCTVVFMLLYYFGMASATWWMVLTVTWFLSAGLRWTNERIQKRVTCFHVIAWTLPAVKTIAILVMRVVDADELTGTCYVGNQNSDTLLGFVIVPSCVYLVLGAGFLLFGLVSMVRSKRTLQKQQMQHVPLHGGSVPKADKIEVLMFRIGIFALLYIVPASCVLAASLYEYSSRDQWLAARSQSRPNVEIFTLKIFMSLVVGITTGLWTWSSKTPLTAWKRVRGRLTDNKRIVMAAYQHPMLQKQLLTVDRPHRSGRVKGTAGTTV